MFFRARPPRQDESLQHVAHRALPSLAGRWSACGETRHENSDHSRFFYAAFLGCSANCAEAINPRRSMACSFSPSSATRLQALEAAAGGKNARIPLKASVSPPLRSLGSCKAARQEFEGATQDPSVSGTTCQHCLLSALEIYVSIQGRSNFVDELLHETFLLLLFCYFDNGIRLLNRSCGRLE